MRSALLLFAVLAAPAASQTLIVGNKAEDSVSFVDVASGREVARPSTGKHPHEAAVSPDGRQVAVVHYGAASVDVFDVATATAVRRIDLSPNTRPHGLVWLTDGRLVATTEGSGTLTVVDPAAGKVLAAIPTGQQDSHMVAVDERRGRAYVSNLGSRTVSVVDLKAGRKLRDLTAGEEPEGIALTPDGRELWVANRRSDDVHVFRTSDLRRVAVAPGGRFPIRIAISPDGRTAVTSGFARGELTLIDVATRKVTATVPVGGAGTQQVTILFSPDGARLFVAETARATVAEVDMATRAVRRFAVGRGGDGLGWSPVTVKRAQ